MNQIAQQQQLSLLLRLDTLLRGSKRQTMEAICQLPSIITEATASPPFTVFVAALLTKLLEIFASTTNDIRALAIRAVACMQLPKLETPLDIEAVTRLMQSNDPIARAFTLRHLSTNGQRLLGLLAKYLFENLKVHYCVTQALSPEKSRYEIDAAIFAFQRLSLYSAGFTKQAYPSMVSLLQKLTDANLKAKIILGVRRASNVHRFGCDAFSVAAKYRSEFFGPSFITMTSLAINLPATASLLFEICAAELRAETDQKKRSIVFKALRLVQTRLHQNPFVFSPMEADYRSMEFIRLLNCLVGISPDTVAQMCDVSKLKTALDVCPLVLDILLKISETTDTVRCVLQTKSPAMAIALARTLPLTRDLVSVAVQTAHALFHNKKAFFWFVQELCYRIHDQQLLNAISSFVHPTGTFECILVMASCGQEITSNFAPWQRYLGAVKLLRMGQYAKARALLTFPSSSLSGLHAVWIEALLLVSAEQFDLAVEKLESEGSLFGKQASLLQLISSVANLSCLEQLPDIFAGVSDEFCPAPEIYEESISALEDAIETAQSLSKSYFKDRRSLEYSAAVLTALKALKEETIGLMTGTGPSHSYASDLWHAIKVSRRLPSSFFIISG